MSRSVCYTTTNRGNPSRISSTAALPTKDYISLAMKKLRDNTNFTTIHTNESVKTYWFSIPHDQRNAMKTAIKHIPNTPDLVSIDEKNKAITIIEIGCSYDAYMDTCYASKLLKYQPLSNVLTNYGYSCTVIALIFGSLGHVHRMCVRGLQICGLSKKRAKHFTKYCSISAVIGSLFIWKRRCHLYP